MPDLPLRVSDFQTGTGNYAIGGHAFSWSGDQLQGLDSRGNFDFPRPVSEDPLAAILCEIDQRSGHTTPDSAAINMIGTKRFSFSDGLLPCA